MRPTDQQYQTTQEQIQPPKEGLPNTGLNAGDLSVIGLVLVIIGAALYMAVTRNITRISGGPK